MQSKFLRSINRDTVLNAVLFVTGAMLITGGIVSGAAAHSGAGIEYDPSRLTEATNAVILYLEGSFGALVMVCSGIGAILSAAFGQYRASLGLMVVAIGSFILRSLMETFFNTEGIMK